MTRAIDPESLDIARVYGEGCLALALASGAEEVLLTEWRELVAAFDSEPRFEAILASPLVGGDEKRDLVERTFRGKSHDLLVDTLQVMRSKGRLGLARAAAEVYRRGWLENKGKIEVRVTSARPLSDAEHAELARAASRYSGKEALLEATVDPKLLGGLVVRIGGDKFDGSVARELARLEELFLARASRELLSGKTYVTSGA